MIKLRNIVVAVVAMLVVTGTIEQENDIGILLDRSRVTQVGEFRNVVATPFRGTAELA